MRTSSFTRWAFCALAVSVAASAAVADSKKLDSKKLDSKKLDAKKPDAKKIDAKVVTVKSKKSLAACTSFDQIDKDDDKVELTIHNTCSVPIDCSITWRVVCAPDSKKRRAVHAGSANLSLGDASSQSTEATATMCKDDSWLLDQVRWNCQPNKD